MNRKRADSLHLSNVRSMSEFRRIKESGPKTELGTAALSGVAYLQILFRGPMTAKQMAKNFDVSEEEMSAVLDRLVSIGTLTVVQQRSKINWRTHTSKYELAALVEGK